MTKYIRIITFALIGYFVLTAGLCDGTTEPKNNVPVLGTILVTPTNVATNANATVQVTATDADNDPLTYAYLPSGGSIVGNTALVNWTAPSTAGAYSVTVTVSDGQGGVATGSANLTVTAPVVVNTQVTGTADFQAGVNSDLSNAQVSLYLSVVDWVNFSPIKWIFIGANAGAHVSWTIPNVIPGTYYLDIWLDNDNSGDWTTGDFVGSLNSGALNASGLVAFQISEGQTKNFAIDMIIL